MIVSGAEPLALEIARDENNDVVADIDHPGVGPWLAANGLTAAEAAWIQPSYGPCGFDGALVCGSDGVTYLCEYIATECAMVEVASEGPCSEDDVIVGEEICVGTEESTSTDDGETTTDDGETTTDGSDGSSTPSRKGCSVADDNPIGFGTGLGLLVLAALRRRRRVAHP